MSLGRNIFKFRNSLFSYTNILFEMSLGTNVIKSNEIFLSDTSKFFEMPLEKKKIFLRLRKSFFGCQYVF